MLLIAVGHEVREHAEDDLADVVLGMVAASRIFQIKNLEQECQQEADKGTEPVCLINVNHRILFIKVSMDFASNSLL